MSYYVAIDLGTTGCRSMLVDSALHVVASSYREYGIITPHDKWVEQDAELWWTLTKETIVEAVGKAQIDPAAVCGISVSSQGITIVPVDRSFSPLCNALSWLDVRAEEEAERLRKEIGEREVFLLTGKSAEAAYSLPKILWLREHEPEVYRSAWKFLMPMDFIVGKLTDNCVTDHTMASGTLLYDIREKCWSARMLAHFGISEELLPQLKWSGELAGGLTDGVAKELGLPAGCPVAVGAQDQRCASLGAGLRDGVMTVSLGTAGAICKYWNEPHTDGDMRIGWSAYVSEGSWVTEGVVNTAAASLRWLRDTMFPGENYGPINVEATEAQERGSALLFYPYLNGPGSPNRYADATGCFYGMSLATKRGDFALAVMEGVAFQIRIILEAMQAYGNVRSLVLFGGGAKSPLWCQIIADITGLRIHVPETEEAAGAGAAILAGVAAGEFLREDPPCLRYALCYEPGARQAAYEKKYEEYRRLEHLLWR